MSDSGSSDATPTSASTGTATATATKTPESTALSSAGRAGFVGAMFLLATSAIGPGFLTQTTTFTDELRAAFAFVIAITLVIDVAMMPA